MISLRLSAASCPFIGSLSAQKLMKVILYIPGSVLLVKIQFMLMVIVATYFGFLFVPLLCINLPRILIQVLSRENSLQSCCTKICVMFCMHPNRTYFLQGY